MSRVKVSLICTVFNEADNIEQFFESIFAMSRLPDEIVIVDAGSSDGTTEIIRRIARGQPHKIVLVVEPGVNIARGRNVAIERAQYDYIAITDAGCRVDVRWLQRIITPFEENQAVDVVGGWTETDPTTTFAKWVSLLHRPFAAIDIKSYIPSSRTLAMKKTSWKAVGGYPEYLTMSAEDTVFFRKLREQRLCIIIVPDAIVYWHPQRNLKELWTQYHKYGVGDGEARLYAWLNLKRSLFVLSPFFLVCGIITFPILVLLSVAILILAFFRIVFPLRSAAIRFWKLIPLFGLVLVSETAQIIGYVRGRLRDMPAGLGKQIVMCMFSTLDKVPPVLNEGTGLAKRGYTVRLLGIRKTDEQRPEEEITRGFNVHRMTLFSRKLFGDNDAFEAVRYVEVAIRSMVWSLFRRVDLYVAHDLVVLPYLYPVARIRRKPIVYRAHELWSEQTKDFPRAGFWRMLDKFFSPRVDLIVSPEVHRAGVYQMEYGALSLPSVVPNCSYLVSRPPRSPLKQLLAERGINNRFIVYYQGGISAMRCTDKLVESLCYMPRDITIVLVGQMDDVFAAWFGNFVEQHRFQNRVVHLGSISHGQALFELCAGADAGVAFVKGDCRNNLFSATATNKLFEYMMMGLPVLTSDHNSYKELVEKEGIGLCVNSEDPESIANGITELYENKSLSKEMGMRARNLAEKKYNWERKFPELLAEYESLILKR